MRAPFLVHASLIAGALIPSAVAQDARAVPAYELREPKTIAATLQHQRDLRALELTGEAGRPYVVFAGIERTHFPLPGGVVIGVTPMAVLSIGHLDLFGRAYVPIDVFGVGGAGDVVYAQALLWSRSSGITILPDQATEVADIELEGPQTGPAFPPFEDHERLRVLEDTGYGDVSAAIAIEDGVPSQHVLMLSAKVPTTGHQLRVDAVRHHGAFTRVFATLERPGPDRVVEEGVVALHASAPLGVWSGKIEVVVDVR